MESSPRPIALVTFDLYDTLIELTPPRWDRLASALARNGIRAGATTLRAADRIAEEYYTAENGQKPIRDRSAAERETFRLAYMARWLSAAGLPDDDATAQAARRAYRAEFEADAEGGDYAVFPDVMPALARLRDAGVARAIISNADDDVTELCTHLAFAHEMDLIVTSALVGWEKPDPRTFHAALDPLGITPADALHVGDQPGSDIVGARAIGMRAALLDRYDRHPDPGDGVLRVHSLGDLAEYVVAGNAVI
ncbi:MAG: HAD-IA family hydrolase [Chloroflexota bacterium]|nr:HAD-IA family hydrolase [Chloroflexota bacterium]